MPPIVCYTNSMRIDIAMTALSIDISIISDTNIGKPTTTMEAKKGNALSFTIFEFKLNIKMCRLIYSCFWNGILY